MTVKYTKEHEWIRVDGDAATVGISTYAQEQLGEIVFVELPDVGKTLKKGHNQALNRTPKSWFLFNVTGKLQRPAFFYTVHLAPVTAALIQSQNTHN